MAHHGIGRNPRLTRLMKKRSRVAPHSSHAIAHHPIPTASGSGHSRVSDGGSQHHTAHGTAQEVVLVLEKRQDIASSDDLTKVWATVVNVVDDDSYTSSESVAVTLASYSSWFDASITAFPAYTSLTADTPSLTSSSQSMASAASSAYSSAVTSRPLINSSLPTPSSTSLTPTASPSSLSGSSFSSATTSASLVTRSSTKTSLPTSWASSSFSSSTSSSTTSSTTSSDSSGYGGWVGGYGGRGGSTQTGSGQAPTSTDSGPTQNSSGTPGPVTTGKIVGGVVGSVAGAVMLVILALLLLKRRASMRKPQEALPSTEGAGAGGNTAGRGAGSEMTSRPDSILTASYFAPAFMKRWRQSSMTTNTDTTLLSSGSERGFQKISGRKIPSVLTYGGDGYGGGYETGSPTISEPSMTTAVPGSPVNPRSPLTQPPPSTPFGMPLDVSYTRETEENDPVMYMRASPARTPVTSTASMSSVSAPINIPRQSHSSLSPIPQRPDTLGRSHPSFDGSRGSRFTESL